MNNEKKTDVSKEDKKYEVKELTDGHRRVIENVRKIFRI